MPKNTVEFHMCFTNGSIMYLSREKKEKMVRMIGRQGYELIQFEPYPIDSELKMRNLEFSTLVGAMNAKFGQYQDTEDTSDIIDDLYEELMEIVD